jgi:hypothetical protein
LRTALIGYTGFIGNNLRTQYQFTDLYNSVNFREMKDQRYDFVVCAGVSGVKWLANKQPFEDKNGISDLEKILSTITAQKFVLISTIDTYSLTESLNEDFDCTQLKNHAYGTHRLEFEIFCNNYFDHCTIVRLPALFGDGIKKNVIYDLLNDNCLAMINVMSEFQYYPLEYLWADVQIAVQNDLKLINLFSEPIPTHKIVSSFFSAKVIGADAAPRVLYSLRSKYAYIWGNSAHYTYTKEQIILCMAEFIKLYKKQELS